MEITSGHWSWSVTLHQLQKITSQFFLVYWRKISENYSAKENRGMLNPRLSLGDAKGTNNLCISWERVVPFHFSSALCFTFAWLRGAMGNKLTFLVMMKLMFHFYWWLFRFLNCFHGYSSVHSSRVIKQAYKLYLDHSIFVVCFCSSIISRSFFN